MTSQKLNDKLFRFLGIPLIAFMGHFIFYNRIFIGDERFGFWTIYFISLAETMILWESNRLVILFFRKKYPQINQTSKRISYILLFCTILTIIVRAANIWAYDKSELWGYRFPLEGYLHSIFVALLFVIIVGGIYEAIYYFRKWKDAAVETEALKRENLQTQLDSLRTQISPHFLFNSLGSITLLIEEDPKRAITFVEAMTSVYRYLLQSHEKQLVTLKEELNFIQAYSQMLKIRFPDGLKIELNIDEKFQSFFLPPLTIQILLENAVKHNSVLSSNPLHVTIYNDVQNRVVVENNIVPKTSPVYSNKMGLHNIITKYKLLNEADVNVSQTETNFKVTVPLIKNSNNESIDSGR